MTTYTPDATKAALEGLLDSPSAVRLEEPITVGTILALAEQVSRARTERDTALARLHAIRQAVRRQRVRWERAGRRPTALALDIEAALEPGHDTATT